MNPARLGSVGLLLLAAGLLLWRCPSAEGAVRHLLLLSAGQGAVAPARALAVLGGFAVLGPVALVLAAMLAWRGERGRALWLILSIGSGRLAVEAVKLLVQRPRPPVAERLDAVTSWSFPSSHSAGTMLTGMAFALLAGGRWPAIGPAVLAAAIVGWSRVALGVHWPSDVLAGWGLGLAWMAAAWRWLPARPGVMQPERLSIR